MRSRVLIYILLFSLACVVLGLLRLNSETNAITLADLVSSDSRAAAPNESVKQLAQSVRDGGLWFPEIDLIFYAVLATCGILLVIRTLVSAVRINRAERLLRSRDHVAYNPVYEPESRGFTKEVKTLRSTEPSSPLEMANDSSTSPLSDARRPDVARTRPSHAWSRLIPYGHRLTAKMIFIFTAIIAAFGSLTLMTVYFTLTSSLTKQWIERARAVAVNVSDSAPAYLFKKDATGLREFLRKRARQHRMAYVVVEDRKGKIFSHSFAALPQELQNTEPTNSPPIERQRLFRIGDGLVYEVRAPVLDGQIGAVRVGISKDEVDSEISKTTTSIMKLVALLVCAGILMTVFLAWRITRPILRLVRIARRISEGELDLPPLVVDDAGEFGEISRSFERMRSSVKAAMTRLRE
jgi:HAMP domain-containing protein